MADIEKQIRCVKREIAKRSRFYPHWIKKGRMTQEKADKEIAEMTAVLRTLEEVQRHGSPQLPF